MKERVDKEKLERRKQSKYWRENTHKQTLFKKLSGVDNPAPIKDVETTRLNSTQLYNKQ